MSLDVIIKILCKPEPSRALNIQAEILKLMKENISGLNKS